MFAIAYDNSSASSLSAWTTNVSTYNWSHTCAGTDTVLIVVVEAWNVATLRTVSGITYNGVALTKITSISDNVEASNQSTEMWYLVNPTTGANTIAVTLSGTTDFNVAEAASYTGVKQVGAIDSSASSQNNGNITSLTSTTTTIADNCWLVGVIFARQLNVVAGANTTLRKNNNAMGFVIADSNGPKSPAGSNSLAYTFSSGTVPGAVICSLLPSGTSYTATSKSTATTYTAATKASTSYTTTAKASTTYTTIAKN